MATIDQLGKALINADAAGDVEAAKMLAAEIKKMQTVEAPQRAATPADIPTTTRQPIPQQPEAPSTARVALSAPYEALGSTADLLLNAPYNVINLGKMAYGAGAMALGRPELAPRDISTPDFATNALRRMGLIKAEENRTPEQRVLSSAIQAGVGGAMMPAASLRQLGSVATKNMLAGGAGQTVSEVTENPLLGMATSMAIPAAMTGRAQRQQAELQAAQQRNAERDATIRNAQQEGFVVTPGSVSPSNQNILLERIGGKTRLEQAASSNNQEVADSLARRAVGLPANQPITSQAMQAIRNEEFQTGYAPISNLGVMPTDAPFRTALNQISQQYTGAGRSFPGAVPDSVNQAILPFRVNQFDSGDAVQAIRALRQRADNNFGVNGDRALGRAQREIAAALENQIERNLANAGNPNAQAILEQFRSSRQRMAISHAIEDAVREGSGSIDAKKLGRELQKNPNLLTGDLRTIGTFANVAPRVNMTSSEIGTPGTGTMLGRGVTGLTGAAVGGMMGNGLGAVAGAVAPEAMSAGARAYLMSQMGQSRAIPNYNKANFFAQETLTPGLRNALLGLPIVNQPQQ